MTTTSLPSGAITHTDTPVWESSIYIKSDSDWEVGLEYVDPTTIHSSGHIQGIANIAEQQLANRTAYLKEEIETLAGKLLNVQVFSAPGTFPYTPTPGTRCAIVEAQGAGGGSGGVPATSSVQGGASCSGGAGAYGKSFLTSLPSGVLITVGQGGAGGAAGANAGNSGGSSSFGSLLSAPGGIGGTVGIAASSFPNNTTINTATSSPSGANLIAVDSMPCLQATILAIDIATGMFIPQASFFGNGPGCGAKGVWSYASTAAVAGNAGKDGIVIVTEYS